MCPVAPREVGKDVDSDLRRWLAIAGQESRAKHDVPPDDVGSVIRVGFLETFRMMPTMKLGHAEEPIEWAETDAYIAVLEHPVHGGKQDVEGDDPVARAHENQGRQREELLRKQINQQWDDELVNFYGRIISKDPQRQFLFAKDWLQDRPGNATLLLTLGRLALACEQWQDARDYFMGSLQFKKTAETCGELARLLNALGDTEKAAQYYQQALAESENALPELPLPKPDTPSSPALRIVKE